MRKFIEFVVPAAFIIIIIFAAVKIIDGDNLVNICHNGYVYSVDQRGVLHPQTDSDDDYIQCTPDQN